MVRDVEGIDELRIEAERRAEQVLDRAHGWQAVADEALGTADDGYGDFASLLADRLFRLGGEYLRIVQLCDGMLAYIAGVPLVCADCFEEFKPGAVLCITWGGVVCDACRDVDKHAPMVLMPQGPGLEGLEEADASDRTRPV